MLHKAWLLLVLAFLQASLVSSQGQQQLIQGMTPAQMWNPYSWTTPFYAAASGSWTDYLKKAQEVGNQLYQQWEKSGAANVFAAGMDYAQQAALQAQQMAQAAAKQAEQAGQAGQQATNQFLQ